MEATCGVSQAPAFFATSTQVFRANARTCEHIVVPLGALLYGERGTKRVLQYARLAMGFANVRAGTRVLMLVLVLVLVLVQAARLLRPLLHHSAHHAAEHRFHLRLHC